MAFSITSEPATPKTHTRRFSCRSKNAYRLLQVENPGLRFYSANLARWINRDPVKEKGGPNLFGFCANSAIGNWDFLGFTEGGDIAKVVKEAQKIYQPKTLDPKNGMEYCGRICRRSKNSKIYYTVLKGEVLLGTPCCQPSKEPCDKNDCDLGSWHTHPAGKYAETFSYEASGGSGDINASFLEMKPTWLITPAGKILEYDPNSAKKDASGIIKDFGNVINWVDPEKPKDIPFLDAVTYGGF